MATLMLLTVVITSVSCTKDKKPCVTTSEVSEINGHSAMGGGVIITDAEDPVIERGLCWGTQPKPEVSGSHAVSGNGAGSFTCEITGLELNTTYYVRAYAINGSGVGYGLDVIFTTLEHAYVDLGLPSGTLWATCNVGATTPEGYGDYFAFGETEPKTNYCWNTYKYCVGDYNQLTKYCNISDFGYNGFTDNQIVLLPEDDAATVNWGDSWCIPSTEQWIELRDHTRIDVTTQNGVNGRLFTASNGNSIFLPAPGFWMDEELCDVGFDGICTHGWSNAIDPRGYPANAWGFSVYSSGIDMGSCRRSWGYTVRAVRSTK